LQLLKLERNDDAGWRAGKAGRRFAAFNLLMGRKRLAGRRSAEFGKRRRCWISVTANAIVADVEVIPIQKINNAYERLLKSDVKYRFSIDMGVAEASVKRSFKKNPRTMECRAGIVFWGPLFVSRDRTLAMGFPDSGAVLRGQTAITIARKFLRYKGIRPPA